MSHSPEASDQQSSDKQQPSNDQRSSDKDEQRRCPRCDGVVGRDEQRCLLCGTHLDAAITSELHDGENGAESDLPEPSIPIGQEDAGGVAIETADIEAAAPFESVMIERQAPVMLWMTAGFAIVIVIVGVLMLQNPAVATLAIFPTETSIPPTVTLTPTWTPLPSETSPPTTVPTITPTPPPTETPRPPRSHTVVSGETLFGVSLRYGVSMDSIAAASGLPGDAALQVSQELLVPWPTPTPPLAPVEVEIGGETIIADPSECRVYEIKGGDTFVGIASRERVNRQALIAANRLTEQSILQPGDTICIPKIIRGGVLPPTPGPSPTASPTAPPAGPSLLYPIQEAEVTLEDEPFFLQWVAVKDLAGDEWYMVELTDLSAAESYPIRGFTRQTSFQVPESWRPTVPETHLLRWRVSIVRVVGERDDASFIYTFGGSSSDDAFFTWQGAVPTAKPLPAATPTPGTEN